MDALFALLCFFLYIVNIIKIIGSLNKPADGLFVLRCAGTVFVPLGCFLALF